MILGVDALSGIDHKYHCIRLGHRLPGLFGHFLEDAALSGGLKPAGIDDNKFLFAVLGVAVMTIPCESRIVGDDGVAGFGDAVKERGFAHIGAAHQSNHRLHNNATLLKAVGRRAASRCESTPQSPHQPKQWAWMQSLPLRFAHG